MNWTHNDELEALADYRDNQNTGPMSDTDIARALLSERLKIVGRRLNIQPASVDLHLGETFLEDRGTSILNEELSPCKTFDAQSNAIQLRDGATLVRFDDLGAFLGIAQRFVDDKRDLLCGSRLPLTFLVLAVGSCVLAHTDEIVTFPRELRGQIRGKSRYDRKMIAVTCGGGYVDPGYTGQLTLSIQNRSNRFQIIQVGAPICQLEIARLTSPAARVYGDSELKSHYQGSMGPVSAK